MGKFVPQWRLHREDLSQVAGEDATDFLKEGSYTENIFTGEAMA
jgi:hypothetical protein